MRVIFAGTPAFARAALAALLDAGFQVPLVLTQPDRPAGRGMQLQASPVKQLALQHGIAVAQPRSLRLDGKLPDDAAAARDAIAAAGADVMVVAAYGLILPQWVLDALPRGCINIHASLLPRWRGAAPIHRAIEAGDPQTGVTLMQMDAGLDTGDMLAAHPLVIAPEDTTATLHDRLALLGASMVVQALQAAAAAPGTPLPRTPQPAQGVTYAHKIEKAEAQIHWGEDAQQIARRIRAFDPFPGASTVLAGEPLKVWQAQASPDDAAATAVVPGAILAVTAQGVQVACGRGSLWLQVLQRAGGRRLGAAEFARGTPACAVGALLG
jgi:methionyl-tRNA formyltransferase